MCCPSVDQESLTDTWCVFRHYAKTFIQPTHSIAELFSLKLNEVPPPAIHPRWPCPCPSSYSPSRNPTLAQWLILFEDAGIVGPTEPKKQEGIVKIFEDTQRRHQRGGSMTLPQYLEALVYASVSAAFALPPTGGRS